MGGFPNRLNRMNSIQPSKLTYVKYSQSSGLQDRWINLQGTINKNSIPNINQCVELVIGRNVTGVSNESFKDCTTLRNVVILGGVTSIGGSVFDGCIGLANVTIGDNVTSIGGTAFRGCTGLTEMTIPDSVLSIGMAAFYECTGLANMTIGSGLEHMGVWPFYHCNSLEFQVSQGNSTYSSLNGMLMSKDGSTLVRGLNDDVVVVPNTVETIGDGAFEGFDSITSVIIGENTTNVDPFAFYECGNLMSFSVSSSNPAYASVDGLLLSKDGTTLVAGINGNVAVPSTVTSIGQLAFAGRTGLTFITIPESVSNIGYSAFMGCFSLTCALFAGRTLSEIKEMANYRWGLGERYIYPDAPDGKVLYKTSADGEWLESDATFNNGTFTGFSEKGSAVEVIIPSKDVNGNSVTDIGSYVFWNCTSLTNVVIGAGVTIIRDYVFQGCTNLTSVTIPNSVTSIGRNAFYGCLGFMSVTIPDSVTSIGQQAFYNCTGLTSVTIPDSVTSIGSEVFYGCSGLTSVTIGDGITSIGDHAFYNCNRLASVTIPNSVTSIESYTFSGCTGLTSVTIGNGVISIGMYAFYNCTNLTSVTIPNSVTSIGRNAFYNCSGLTSVTIPDSVTSIGNNVFYGCSALTSVTIPDSVTSIGYQAFSNCNSALYDITTIPGLKLVDGWVVENNGNVSGTIDVSYTRGVGGRAFYNCTGLTNVIMPSDQTSIESYTFNGCTGLTDITIPNSVITINTYAFRNCTGLTSVTIPSGVIDIKGNAFSGCTNISTIYANPTTAPTVASSVFGTTTTNYTGRNAYSSGMNLLVVKDGATGYDSGYWLDPLQDSTKCGFTLKHESELT